ncbi:MAG: hypothetical protein EBX19_06790 [Actinobacteria bacterium]|nr:hypothetical protein [Actinomycetota bacterium]
MENRKEQLNSSKYELFILISEISAALWVHIMAFETTLREFISEKLQKVYGVMEWWLINNLLSKKDLNDVKYAISRLDNRKLSVNNENITSNLSLSFWVELLGRRYHETIWLKIISFFSSYPGRREDFYRKAGEIRNLRNVIAHHGPILRRDLFRDHAYLHQLTALLDPELANEVRRKSRVLDLLLNARLVGSGGGI